jgi:serine/threonine protein kinase
VEITSICVLCASILLQPENILLASKGNETLIKVADFGVSKILTPGTKMDTLVGTPFYTAPEILNNTHEVYTKQVDIWSMGIVLYFWYDHANTIQCICSSYYQVYKH